MKVGRNTHFLKKCSRGVDFLSKSVVKNIIPVESVMCKWRVFVLALLKGMEVKLHPLMTEAY
jgi:hypothetical protein